MGTEEGTGMAGTEAQTMGLDLALLAIETGSSPETHVPGQSRPNKLGGENSLRGTDPWMREAME